MTSFDAAVTDAVSAREPESATARGVPIQGSVFEHDVERTPSGDLECNVVVGCESMASYCDTDVGGGACHDGYGEFGFL